jgi:ketosteroid isomerase-like protein
MTKTLMGAVLALACATATAADGLLPGDPLYQAILAHDQKLFDAYNRCDLPAFGAMVSDDIEFYHDQGGLMVGKAPLLKALENNICHKVRRELVKETLEVYPLANYGAIEIGTHTFCNLTETPVCAASSSGTGKLVHLWKKQGDGYVLARVLSFDHLSGWERAAHSRPTTAGVPK